MTIHVYCPCINKVMKSFWRKKKSKTSYGWPAIILILVCIETVCANLISTSILGNWGKDLIICWSTIFSTFPVKSCQVLTSMVLRLITLECLELLVKRYYQTMRFSPGTRLTNQLLYSGAMMHDFGQILNSLKCSFFKPSGLIYMHRCLSGFYQKLEKTTPG